MGPDLTGRRDFMKQIARTGAVLAGSAAAAFWLHDRPVPETGGAVVLPRFSIPLGPSDPRLAIVHGASVDRMVRAAVGELGGMARFITRGDTVLVKPNAAFDRGPALGATTRPAILKAVVTLCRDAGARAVIVADNPINAPEAAFYRSGLTQAAEEAGATVMYPRGDAFRPLNIGGEVLHTWPIFYRPLERATKVIGVAPLKDHNLCQASMTMKNWYGLLGGSRNQFHQKIHEVIADLAFMIAPTLVFLDATRILMSNGPTGGSLSDVAHGDTIVCGVDPVAVDAYGFTLLGRDPAHLEYLALADARGIGKKDWKTVPRREISLEP